MGLTPEKIDQLRAEFLRDQLWQFISIDEWLDGHLKALEAEAAPAGT